MNRWLFLMLTVFAVAVAPVTAQTPDKPMIMPAAGDPGPGTWMFGQAYGNTTGAFNFGDRWYEAGQGLHFGIDLAMPCGTPLVAVADGTVQFVDDRGFGSMPHNVIIRHEAIGVTTLYGHLLQTPNLMPGQLVQQGQVIAQSGDPDETCDSRPHLHFEVRSMDYSRTLNPSALIDANWDNLSLIGPYSFPLFQQNLANPRQWVTVEDQPDVYFWGTILNRYNVTYPPRFDRRPAPMPTAARSAPDLEDGTLFNSRPITQGGCCVLPRWDAADSDTFYVSDGPPGGGALVYQWNLANVEAGPVPLRPAPMPYQSPGAVLDVEPFVNGTAKVVGPDFEAVVETGNRIPTVNTSNDTLLWVNNETVAIPGQQRPSSRVMIAQINGDNIREIFAAPGADARWMDPQRVLISVRNQQRETQLLIYSLATNELRELGQWREMRGLDVSPGGRYVMFYLSWQTPAAANGVYLIDTQLDLPTPRQVPWFGSWRWRDVDELYYIPFEPDATHQTLRLYNVITGADTVLAAPSFAPFSIANGHWEVSPDGTRILYQSAFDNNIYVLE